MAANLPACPPNLKPISHFLKCAQEHGKYRKNFFFPHMIHCDLLKINLQTKMTSCSLFINLSDERDPVVSYWSRLYGLQTGLKLSTKQPEETALLIGIFHSNNNAATVLRIRLKIFIFCF